MQTRQIILDRRAHRKFELGCHTRSLPGTPAQTRTTAKLDGGIGGEFQMGTRDGGVHGKSAME
eukprot:5127911-Pyramimonas_sp.AAC.1